MQLGLEFLIDHSTNEVIWDMQIYPIKKFHFCIFLYVFACESFILAHRFNGLDGFLVVNN